MKIKRTDGRPIVIHIKEKPKLHIHRTNAAVKRTGKPKAGKTGKGGAGRTAKRTGAGIKSRRTPQKKTADKARTAKIRRNGRTGGRKDFPIRKRKTSIHLAGTAAAAGTRQAAGQMEGAQEICDAAMLSYTAAKPVTGAASKGAAMFRQKAAGSRLNIKKADERIKKHQKAAGDRSHVAPGADGKKKTGKRTDRTGTKEKAGRSTRKEAPGRRQGGNAKRRGRAGKGSRSTAKSRGIQMLLARLGSRENGQGVIAKLVKDAVTQKIMAAAAALLPIAGAALLFLALIVALVAVPVIGILEVLYSSPFAIFLPPLQSGDTVQNVTSAYVAQLDREVSELASVHEGCEAGEVVYVDYEGMSAAPSNYNDIMAVYMVRYGVGEMAAVMDDTARERLSGVVNDMYSYTTSTGTQTVEGVDASGNAVSTARSVLYVNVTLKSWHDMIPAYGFDDEQAEILAKIMGEGFAGSSGTGGVGTDGGGTAGASMTEAEIGTYLSGITDSTQRSVCDYALHRVGCPYSQELRGTGNYYDCSYLAYSSWRAAGADISYGGSVTAAAEAQGLEEAGWTVPFSEMQPGDLIFYSNTKNGRYRNISHVAIYVGGGKIVEAQNPQNGVVICEARPKGSIVLVARPQP